MVNQLLERYPPLKKLPTEFLFFALIGGVATLIDWSLFYYTHVHLGWHYLASVTLTFLVGSTKTFLANKYLNFGDPSKQVLSQFGVFLTIAGGGLLLTYGILVLLIGYLKVPAMVSRVTATFLILFYNFFAQKNITFRVSKTSA